MAGQEQNKIMQTEVILLSAHKKSGLISRFEID
jgi:hypothetical protein